jgi:chromosome segregation ATPase
MHEELKRHLESERSAQDKIFGLVVRLRDSEQSVERLRLELREAEAGHQLAQEQLNLASDMKAQVDNYRTLFEESKETFKRSREELDSKLQSSLQSLNDVENKMRQEVGDRQRLQESLASVQERFDRNALELSKLQSELQVERLERKQLEGDAAHSRYATLDSARVSRAQTSTLKRQLREPLDALLHSSRVLLDADLSEDQKKEVESLLENSLLVQACLQESASSPGSSAAPAIDAGDDQGAPPSEGGEADSGEVPQAA